MGSKIEYVESSHMYATTYVRNSKGIGVLWAIFTICYAIIGVVAFVTPEWIGDVEAESPARFGLWSLCQADETGERCRGRLDEFGSIPSTAFQAATIFVGVAVFFALSTLLAMVLFFFCQSTTVFHICGWMQIISAACMIAGCACYPAGWSEPSVRRTCGPNSDRYSLGRCGLRWAYLLAAIGCLDAIILASLAFILATRHVRLQAGGPRYSPAAHSVGYKGEINAAYDSSSVAGSRKSLNLHPVLLMHPHPAQDDTYSQFSQRTATARSKASQYRSGSMHNFQL